MSHYPSIYDRDIRIIVSKRLAKKDLHSIIRDFIKQKLTFAISKVGKEFEIWRGILDDDSKKSKQFGATPSSIIEMSSNILSTRNFVCIWDHGRVVFGSFKIGDINYEES